MLIIFLTLLSINNLKLSILLEKTTNFSQGIHQSCLSILPKSSQYNQAYAALLCGKNITELQMKKSLIKSSLIHLFVVSGSHLLLIEELLLKISIPFFLRFLITWLYCLACGWQAPIVRAWISLSTRFGYKKLQLCLPSDVLVFWVGILNLILFPDWISSRSLIMSWLAALALSVVRLFRVRSVLAKLLIQSTLIYLMMMPALWGFGNLHPLSIAFNVVLAPLVSFCLMPLAVLSSLIKSWVPVFDRVCWLFFWLSAQGTEPIVLSESQPLSLSSLWIFILLTHLAIHFFRVHWIRRKRCV